MRRLGFKYPRRYDDLSYSINSEFASVVRLNRILLTGLPTVAIYLPQYLHGTLIIQIGGWLTHFSNEPQNTPYFNWRVEYFVFKKPSQPQIKLNTFHMKCE